MTITHLVSTPGVARTVGSCMPAVVAAFGAIEGNLNGQLAAQGNLSIALTAGPPSIAVAADIEANVAASVTSPTFGIALDSNLSAIAAINAALAALAGMIAALGAAGIEVYAYSGTAADFGTAVAGETSVGLPGGSGGDAVNALVLATQVPEAWAALAQIMVTA